MNVQPKAVTLIAGGAGFIGRHLTRRLLETNEHILCVDNFSTSSPAMFDEFADNKRVQLIEHDIVEQIPEELNACTIGAVYNLAAIPSPVHYLANPVETWKTNTIGTLNLLELARHHEARFLQASSSEVYGNPLVHPQPETYSGNIDPTGERAAYTEGKRAAETITITYAREFDVDVRIARIFNTYGPGMATDDGRVVSSLVKEALLGNDLPVHGNGKQTRSFCHVADLVQGLVELMNTPKARGIPVNIGNDHEISMNRLAEMVNTISSEITGMHSRITHSPSRSQDPARRCPDLSLLRRLMDWKPKTELEAGLRETIDEMAGSSGQH